MLVGKGCDFASVRGSNAKIEFGEGLVDWGYGWRVVHSQCHLPVFAKSGQFYFAGPKNDFLTRMKKVGKPKVVQQ